MSDNPLAQFTIEPLDPPAASGWCRHDIHQFVPVHGTDRSCWPA